MRSSGEDVVAEVKHSDDSTLESVPIHCEKGDFVKPFKIISTSQKNSEPLYLCLPIPVNRTRDEMSPRMGRQIYGPPDVADLRPLFNLQIPAT